MKSPETITGASRSRYCNRATLPVQEEKKILGGGNGVA